MEPLIWIGIALCVSQSATFSGLNLALFGVSRLRLEVDVANGSADAARLLELRKDSNFLLTTILWGNVAANCLLTILSDSVLAGVSAFVFSTVVITFLGEIIPQAYFSRHALRMVSRLSPILRFYQLLLYPIAKPSAAMLNHWLGYEGVQYYRERDLRELLQKHVLASETDLGHIEGLGAVNFLKFDDLSLAEEGELIDPKSILRIPSENGKPRFPPFERVATDPFIQKIQASEKKWVICIDDLEKPALAIDSDAFLREVFFAGDTFNPYRYAHRPIVVTDPGVRFSDVLPQLNVQATNAEDDVIDHDIIVLWGDQKRVITGSDILGRLLRGIVRTDQTPLRN